jgi:hypothetical protein
MLRPSEKAVFAGQRAVRVAVERLALVLQSW